MSALLLLITLTLTQSRGACLGAAVALLALFSLRWPKLARVVVPLAITVTLVGASSIGWGTVADELTAGDVTSGLDGRGPFTLSRIFPSPFAYRAFRRVGQFALAGLCAGCIAGLIGMCAHGLVDAATWGLKLAFIPWVVMGLVVGLHEIAQEQSRQ